MPAISTRIGAAFWIFTGLCIAACGNSKKANQARFAAPPEQLQLKKGAPDQIVFLTFDVALKDSSADTYSFRQKNVIYAEGFLKGNDFKEEPAIENFYLFCQLSNDKGETSNWIKAEDPLNKMYEHPGEGVNDLGKTVFKSKTGELMIRFQSDGRFRYLSIYKPEANTGSLKKIYYAAF